MMDLSNRPGRSMEDLMNKFLEDFGVDSNEYEKGPFREEMERIRSYLTQMCRNTIHLTDSLEGGSEFLISDRRGLIILGEGSPKGIVGYLGISRFKDGIKGVPEGISLTSYLLQLSGELGLVDGGDTSGTSVQLGFLDGRDVTGSYKARNDTVQIRNWEDYRELPSHLQILPR